MKPRKSGVLWLEVPCHVRSRPVNERSVDACEQPVSSHFFRPGNTSTDSLTSQIADRRFRDNDVPDWFDLNVVCLTPGALPSSGPGKADSGGCFRHLTVWPAAFRHASSAQETVNSALTLSAMMASTMSRSIPPSGLKSMRTR
jgi:hypothetical protein